MDHASQDLQGRIDPEIARRVWIENVQPTVDAGRYPIKRCVGEDVLVTADIFADGHDLLAAVLRYRPVSEAAWQEVPMEPRVNDAWAGRFSVERLETYEYTIEAWVDHFATWQDEVRKKYQAGQDIESELLEGAALIEEAGGRAVEPDRGWLTKIAFLLKSQAVQGERVERGLSPDLTALMNRYPDRSQSSCYRQALQVIVERIRARYGAWYEMFPRSTGSGPKQSGTFRDAARHLSYIAEMGFDVVYLPPIHPIGRTHRKGPNNSLAAGPDDPGSPWAIGGRGGGAQGDPSGSRHLGGFPSFRSGSRPATAWRWRWTSPSNARRTIPMSDEHPEWFRHRPDGSDQIRRKPAQEIPGHLPPQLRDPSLGVTLGRAQEVDHLLGRAGGAHLPGGQPPHQAVLLLGVADRRSQSSLSGGRSFWPKPSPGRRSCTRLAKLGFSQSYTYFTWRNTKRELTEYLTELTRSGVREFFRPNFLPNTPDILPEYLQFGGRPAFHVPAGAGRHPGRELRHLQRRTNCAKTRQYRARKNTSSRKNTRSGIGTGTGRKACGNISHWSTASAVKIRHSTPAKARLSSDRQRAAALFRQDYAEPRQHHPGGDQSRPAPRARRLGGAAPGGAGHRPERALPGARSDRRRALPLAGAAQLRAT